MGANRLERLLFAHRASRAASRMVNSANEVRAAARAAARVRTQGRSPPGASDNLGGIDRYGRVRKQFYPPILQ
jgi:hypothetical protein